MFSPLSFKKFQRRMRSPFTIFKKLGKKSKQSKHKRGPSQVRVSDVVAEKQNEPDTLVVPKFNVPSTPSTVASSDCDAFPPTPKSVSSELAPASRVRVAESALSEIPNENAIQNTDVPEEVIDATKQKDTVVLDGPVEVELETQPESQVTSVDVSPIEEKKDQFIPSASETAPVQVLVQDTIPAMPESEEPIVAPSARGVTAEPIQTTGPVVEIITSIEQEAVLVLPETQIPELVFQEDDEAHVKDAEAEIPSTPNAEATTSDEVQITTAPLCVEPKQVIVEVSDQSSSPTTHVEEGEAEVQTPVTPTIRVLSLDTPALEPHTPVKVFSKHESPSKSTFNHSASQPASPAFPRSILKSPSTPRMRVTSEGQSASDKNIMDELQASVRSRDNKRLAQERANAAEKERELRLRMEAKAKDGIVDEQDADEVLKEVRSWRKQREASLKTSPDDAAKNAAYREAFAREEIMVELLNSVQDRSTRTPFTEDPAEKRQQLVLEELFANRARVLAA